MDTPIPESYWVVPGKLLAGRHPARHYDMDDLARRQLGAILQAGVNAFYDLTHPAENTSYERLLHEQADWLGMEAEYIRWAIHDFTAPPVALMEQILEGLDSTLAAGKGVYVHCWGGIGRTGTVVGCYLVRHGMPGRAALQHIDELRRDMPGGWVRSPESDEQWRMVLNWPVGDNAV